MDKSLVAGVDIGGSHITVALVDVNSGAILQHTRKRLPINSQSGAQTIIAAWSRAIGQSFAAHHISPTRLGIAMPGPFDYEKGISLIRNQNKYDTLYGLNVKQMLSDSLNIDVTNISITNDAACFLQGEVFGGVAKGCAKVLGLTLGTGLGAARWTDGKAEDANLWCASFKDATAEDYLSTRWFVNRYFHLSGEAVNDVKELATAADANPFARQVFAEFGANLGEFVLPYVLAEGTEMIVLGGNIANAFPLFAAPLEKALKEHAVQVEIRQTALGENAALVGAASF